MLYDFNMLEAKNDTVANPARDHGTVSPLEAPDVDLALLDYNLSLSFEERVAHHQSALDLLVELRQAGEMLRANENETRSR